MGLIIAALLVLGLLGWAVGLGPNSGAPSHQPIEGLSDSVAVHLPADAPPTIDAASPTDALTALGYVHGRKRAWTIAFWRQTALGRLGRWFGPGVTPLDRHARRLGLARHAREAYERLPEAQRSRLQAYTQGMNAALQTEAVREADPFVLLELSPEPWAPWHTLLIERLLAWTATDPLSVPDAAPAVVAQFADTDRRFRRWLHLHGWNRSVAWAVHPDSTQPILFQRHVLGNSARPLVQEVLWDRPDASPVTWATLPGSLLFPTGTTPQRAWASLLHSDARLTRASRDAGPVRYWHERLAPKNSDERLLRVERLGDALLLASAAPADSLPRDSSAASVWTLRWPGFSPGSDLAAWLHRGGVGSAPPDSAAFSLFAADGLQVSDTNSPTVLGTPPVRTSPHADLTAIGRSRWTQFQAAGVAQAMSDADSVAVGAWSKRTSSPWAAALAPQLQAALPSPSRQSGITEDAVTYLRNWDYGYESISIGAVVFDAWMRAYRSELGRVPMPHDTAAYFAQYQGRRAFQHAVDTLRTRLGPDTREWRWSRMVTDRRSFPVWSADSLINADLSDLATTRYAPIERTASGHPSVPSGGPSLLTPSPIAPSPDTWTGWMHPGRPMTVRRHRFAPEAFLARWRLEGDRPSPLRVRPAQSIAEMLLIPDD